MTEATAYRLKQIMTADHLSVTQTAKMIGISPASMRKVLKDTQMSRPIQFKINRFIDAHPLTSDGNVKNQPNQPEEPKRRSRRSRSENEQKSARKTEQSNQKAQKAQKAEKSDKSSAAKTEEKNSKNQPQAKPENQKQAGQKPASTQRPRARQNQKNAESSAQAAAAKEVKLSEEEGKREDQKTPAERRQEARAARRQNNDQPKRRYTRRNQQQNSSESSQSTSQSQSASQSAPAASAAESTAASVINSTAKSAVVSAAASQSRSQTQSQTQSRSQNQPAKSARSEKPVQSEQTERSEKSSRSQTPRSQQSRRQAAERRNNQQQQSQQPASQSASQTSEPVQSQSQPVNQLASQATRQLQVHPTANKRKGESTLLIYLDESFAAGGDYQRNMYIGATVVDPENGGALNSFANALYPFGWQSGDEVKARGKSHEQIAKLLQTAKSNEAQTLAVYSPQSDTGNFSLGFGILYPYLASLVRIIAYQPEMPAKVRVTLDQRSEIADDQLGLAARMMHGYLKAQTGKDIIFLMRTADSKSTLGVQYSDFIAHAAMSFRENELGQTGITRLPDLGSQNGDELTLYSMVGLQKFLLDDQANQPAKATPFKHPLLAAAARMFNLATKATNLTNVPEDTLSQAKLVLTQLLQIAPPAISGAINKMPFQNWYDIAARTSAILHYNDETLPEFTVDQNAMQIASDALNNIATQVAAIQ